MGMRLLSKQEITRAQSVEKQREMDEGLKLARRVDALRETAAQEEASLAKFRRETVANIHEHITEVSTKRDSLIKEVRDLEDRRVAALQPLDEEWKKVEHTKSALSLRERNFTALVAQLAEDERRLNEDRQRINTGLAHVEAKHILADSRLHDTTEKRQRTQQLLEDAEAIQGQARQVAVTINEALAHREREVSEREKNATLERERLSALQKELASEWRKLKDRKQMLERNFNRKTP